MNESQKLRVEAIDKGIYLENALGSERYLELLRDQMKRKMPKFNYDEDVDLFTSIGDRLVIDMYDKLNHGTDIYKSHKTNPLLT
jgi:uncharacterized alkaline shock family protein YloU